MEIFLDAIQLLSTKIGNDVNNCLNVNKLEQNTGFQMVTDWVKANLDKLTDNYSNQILLFFKTMLSLRAKIFSPEIKIRRLIKIILTISLKRSKDELSNILHILTLNWGHRKY